MNCPLHCRVIGAALVLAAAGTSQAVTLNPNGTGEVLLFPYYTVNGGNSTLLTVSNTTEQVKALKFRFMESRNAREVLSFNVYLGPRDTWTAALAEFESGGPAALLTNDQSCSVPDIIGRPNSRVNFRPFAYSGLEADGAGEGLDRTREGYFQVIEMGVVAHDLEDGVIGDELGDYAAQNNDGIPNDCAALDAAWSPSADAQWSNDPNADMSEPSGGLFGSVAIVNVNSGYQSSYSAQAIAGFYNPRAAEPISLHSVPGSLSPTLADGFSGTSRESTEATLINSNGDVVKLTYERSIDAISALLMKRAIHNDYAIETVLDAATDWVVTLPTRHFYVEADSVEAPFTSSFGVESELGAADAAAAEPISLNLRDREALNPFRSASGELCCGPRPIPAPRVLRYASNVIGYNRSPEPPTESAILGSPDQQIVDLSGVASRTGGVTVEFDRQGQKLVSREGVELIGLPVVGVAIQIARNGSISVDEQTILSNYASASPHRGTIQIGSANN